jgi:hypothetical protein
MICDRTHAPKPKRSYEQRRSVNDSREEAKADYPFPKLPIAPGQIYHVEELVEMETRQEKEEM